MFHMSYRNIWTTIKKSISKHDIYNENSANTYPPFNHVLRSNVDNSTSNSLRRIKAEIMVFIPFPWIKYSLSIDSPFINCPRNSHIDKFTASKNNHSIKYIRRCNKRSPLELSVHQRMSNRKLPQQNSILCNLKEIICQRIHGKAFLQESIFAKVAINMRNVGRLFRLTDSVKQCSGGSLQKCRRVLCTPTQRGINMRLQFQVHLHHRHTELKSRLCSLESNLNPCITWKPVAMELYRAFPIPSSWLNQTYESLKNPHPHGFTPRVDLTSTDNPR